MPQLTNIYKLCLSNYNMKKILKKWGNSFVIVFTKEDVEAYDLKEGTVIDLKEMVIQKKGENND